MRLLKFRVDFTLTAHLDLDSPRFECSTATRGKWLSMDSKVKILMTQRVIHGPAATLEFVRNARSWALPQTYRMRICIKKKKFPS